VGQKVNPTGFRLGVYIDWSSSWFARDSYGKSLLQDFQIRKLLEKTLEKAEVSSVKIEKTGESVRIIINSGRPGMVIGKKGQEIEGLRKELSSLLNLNNIEISVQEIKKPELDAKLVAESIADQLVRRANFKKAMKKAAASAIKSGARGVKIRCAGRLGGAEIARDEWTRIGSIPLHTLRSDIDYALAEAKTKMGIVGVKVWICKGEYQLAKKRSS